MMMIYK